VVIRVEVRVEVSVEVEWREVRRTWDPLVFLIVV
jgi:hypothetical protein